MATIEDLSHEDLTRGLTYASLVLVAFELVKDMIVGPIKAFYADTTFAPESHFKSYENDVRIRHSNEFEACLLYLREMEKGTGTFSLPLVVGKSIFIGVLWFLAGR